MVTNKHFFSAIEYAEKKKLKMNISAVEKTTAFISCRNQKIEKIEKYSDISAYLTLIKDRKSVNFSCNNMNHIVGKIDESIDMLNYLHMNSGEESIEFNHLVLNLECTDFPHRFSKREISNLIDCTLKTENAALNNSKITNSNGARIISTKSKVYFANTDGVIGGYEKENLYSSVEVIAGKGCDINTGSCYYIGAINQDIDFMQLGKSAANNAISGLYPRKIHTCDVPIVFNNESAESLIGCFASAINGENLTKSVTFLQDKLNERIFSTDINIINNPINKKSSDYAPFDCEGMPTYKIDLIRDGNLNSFLLTLKSAKKLGMKSNGCAKRNSNGEIISAHSNLQFTTNKNISEDEIIHDIKKGIYVTDVYGFGVNNVTGDYSQGVKGFWIENGKIEYPVSEITIAGNLMTMFKNIKAANNTNFQHLINTPTLSVGNMIVGGH